MKGEKEGEVECEGGRGVDPPATMDGLGCLRMCNASVEI